MPNYNVIHFQNARLGQEAKLRDWLSGELMPALKRHAAVTAVTALELQAVQMQPQIDQPWRFALLYELHCENLQDVLSQLALMVRLEGQEIGLVERDVAYAYKLTRSYLPGVLAARDGAPLHVTFVLGNCIEGKEAEYDRWYDEVHSPEVLGTPGFVSMRRGILADAQMSAIDKSPANRLVLLQIRSFDLSGTINEFISRAHGTSPSGVKWSPREAAASFASLNRTTHVFTPFAGDLCSES